MVVLTALMVLAAPLIDGVPDEGDAPRLVWVWHRRPFDGTTVLKSTPRTAVPASPRQPTTCLYSGGKTCRPLESTVVDVLAISPGHLLLDRGCRLSIQAVCRTVRGLIKI